MRCIAYCSTADELWADGDLRSLVAHAREKNARLGITGLIAYRNRQFVQILEGPEREVEALFHDIERDPRHVDLCLLLRRKVAGRAFADWSLALIPAQDETASPDLEGAADLLQAAATLARTELNEITDAPMPNGFPSLRRPTQQDRARETVARLFLSARDILVRAGAAALTVPRLAQEAGVSQPTFYRYFGDINDFFRSAVLRTALRRAEDWCAVIDAAHFETDADLANLVTALGTKNFMRMQGMPPELARALLPHVNAVTKEAAAAVAPAVLRAIARCNLATGEALDEEAMTALLAGMLSAAIVMAGANMHRLRTGETRRIAAGMFLGGLRAAYRTRDLPEAGGQSRA